MLGCVSSRFLLEIVGIVRLRTTATDFSFFLDKEILRRRTKAKEFNFVLYNINVTINNLDIKSRLKLKLNSVAFVRKRTILTERPPIVGEVSANLCG
jgi:hypothetical protein